MTISVYGGKYTSVTAEKNDVSARLLKATGSSAGCAVSRNGKYIFLSSSGNMFVSSDYGASVVQSTVPSILNSTIDQKLVVSDDGNTLAAIQYGQSFLYVSRNQTAFVSIGFSGLSIFGMDMSADGQTIYVSGSGSQGGLWKSSDGGATAFQRIVSNINCMSCACSADGKVVLLCSNGGAQLLSRDAGATFVSVGDAALAKVGRASSFWGRETVMGSGNTPDFFAAVAVSPFSFLVSADGGVTYGYYNTETTANDPLNTNNRVHALQLVAGANANLWIVNTNGVLCKNTLKVATDGSAAVTSTVTQYPNLPAAAPVAYSSNAVIRASRTARLILLYHQSTATYYLVTNHLLPA